MRALTIELRHSPSTLALPLFILLGYLAAESSRTDGVWIGDNVTTSVLASVQLTGPLAAGLAVWFAMRETRRGTTALRQLSGRGALSVVAVEIFAVALPALAASLLVTGALAVRGTAAGMYGGVSLLGVTVALAGLLVHVCVGYAAGRAWPRPALAPLVAFALYLYAGLNLDYAGRPAYLLSPVTVENAGAYFGFAPGVLGWQALWLFGTAASLLMIVCLALAPRRQQAVVVTLTATVAAVGAMGVLGYDGRPVVPRDDPALACSSTDQVRLCTHPAFSPGRAELLAAFTPAIARLAHSPAATAELTQAPRQRRDDPRDFHVDSLAEGFAAGAVVEYVGSQQDVGACRGKTTDFNLSRLVIAWIVTGNAPSGFYADVQPLQAESLDGLDTLASQQLWIAENFEAFRTCSLSSAVFP